MSKSGNDARKFDVRTIERNIKQGTITRKEVQAYRETLPDVASKAVKLAQVATPERRESPRPETLRSVFARGSFDRGSFDRAGADRGFERPAPSESFRDYDPDELIRAEPPAFNRDLLIQEEPVREEPAPPAREEPRATFDAGAADVDDDDDDYGDDDDEPEAAPSDDDEPLP